MTMNERAAWAAGEWALVDEPAAAPTAAVMRHPSHVAARPAAWAAGEWAIISEPTRPRMIAVDHAPRTVTRRARGVARRTWAAGEWALSADDVIVDPTPSISTAGVPHDPLPPARAPMSRLPALPVHRESSPRMTMSRTSG
jgi:hypothetical protein